MIGVIAGAGQKPSGRAEARPHKILHRRQAAKFYIMDGGTEFARGECNA
jgi:hypothetical protein